MKTEGQIAYEEDVRRCPKYKNGLRRPSWASLSAKMRQSWEEKPRPGQYDKPKRLLNNHQLMNFLRRYTVVHELHVFPEADLRTAMSEHKKSEGDEICNGDMVCRLAGNREGLCYLHYLLKKRSERCDGNSIAKKKT